MKVPPRVLSRAWLIVLAGAAGFLGWSHAQRAQRVQQVTATDREDAIVDAASPTGYADGKRWLIVPQASHRSYQWLAETQQMLARHEWRVRHVDSENAPFGRAVHAASPYRWWLGLLAWGRHVVSGQPLGLAVEWAALWADPLLQLVLLLGTTLYIARQFGGLPATLFAAGLATLYPIAGRFLPGVPDDHGLVVVAAFWSVLPLLPTNGRRQPLVAGVAGGFGLWVSVSHQAPILAGIFLGSLLASWVGRTAPTSPATANPPSPWRRWALSGAIASLFAYLLEYFPSHLEWRLEAIHPLYALAWLGLGELLTWADNGIRRRNFRPTRRAGMILLAAIAAVVALPVAFYLTRTAAGLTADVTNARLTNLPDAPVAATFAAWFGRDGLSRTMVATLLPLLLTVPAWWLLVRRQTDANSRASLALGGGALLVALAFAWRQLAWWNTVDALVLAVVCVAAADASWRRARAIWSGAAVAVFAVGFLQVRPPARSGDQVAFTPLEAVGLVERALAHWVADRAGPGGAVVLLPPDRTPSWCFHGGVRGIGTANWENRDGLAATVRIVSATSLAEAQALINQRGITHLILPSWDTDLDQFARWSVRNPEDAFIAGLRHWALPPWLRPIPYQLPAGVGFDDESVVVLEVTEEASRALAVSRLAEYFVETRRLDQAAEAGVALARFPTDLSALVALAQVHKARGDAAEFQRGFAALVSGLAGGSDRSLAWDRRVSLAIVLAQGGRNDLSRDQLRRCFERIDEARLRSLTTASLFRLHVLAKAFALELPGAELRARARRWLPPELRAQL